MRYKEQKKRVDEAIEEVTRLRRLEHEAEFWEGRYRTQHKTVHALEDEITRLRRALDRAPAMIQTVGEYERWYIEDCYPALNGTQNGTPTKTDSDDPQNAGSKPEYNHQEDYY